MKIRVLIVDDSVVVRRMLGDVLAEDPSIAVVGTAASGRIALSMIPQVNPDLVTLDVEMPEMSGLDTLKELRRTYPRLPVIMVSSRTEKGAEATLDALTLGANDYVAKPSQMASLEDTRVYLAGQLIPKVKALTHRSPIRTSMASMPVTPRPAVVQNKSAPAATRRIEMVAIGISTGGPNALAEVIPAIPAHFPVPITIVQHMPAHFTRLLAERLASRAHIPVHEGSAGTVIEPGHAWVAPGDFHMTLSRSGTQVVIQTIQTPPENSCRPSVDVLFRSVVDVYGGSVLAVVMTGMGQDGLRGCERVREAGGQVIVQDEETSVVWGMPGYVAQAGLADKVVPLSQIAQEIDRRVQDSRKTTFSGRTL